VVCNIPIFFIFFVFCMYISCIIIYYFLLLNIQPGGINYVLSLSADSILVCTIFIFSVRETIFISCNLYVELETDQPVPT